MKKCTIFLVIILAGAAALTSCEKGAQLYDVTISAYYPEGYGDDLASDVNILIENTISGQKFNLVTNTLGTAEMALEEGMYKISATKETDDFYLNGITENLTVQPTGTNNWDVHLVATSKEGGLVFKEIYYTGSKTESGSNYYSDQFHEIYNNSDEVVYLDGLCFGLTTPLGSTETVWVNPDGSIMDRIPCTFHVLMVPGTGQQYPLQPRTSTVLAMDAIDHKTDPLGNPLSPVNLAGAQFEAFIEAPGKDTDAPQATNMIVMYTTSASMVDWLHTVNGQGVIMFRLPTGLDWQTFVANPDNFMTQPGSTSQTQYFMVHKDWVVDGVECNRPEEDKRFKRLPTSVDAGMTWSLASYNSKSVRRKVEKILDGKAIYKDSNNSYNDFINDLDPTPFEHPTTVDN
ncbi:MAG: DUF4876 domain-containing protein [Bacteroidales bacterium]|jgi:hypothetical protein|nr:DUF4876 domain-containing protein [Bacteroidales bacterium]NLD63019.1 DUF4876 domain-containing protein [Bacteroidales bacterium]